MNNTSLPQKKVTLDDHGAPPLLTIALLIGSLAFYQMFGNQKLYWLSDHCFQAAGFFQAAMDHQFNRLLTIWAYTNVASLYFWQLIGSTYFLWLFGVAVEKRMGTARFSLLVLLGSTIPWLLQAWDATNPAWPFVPNPHVSSMQTVFLGPSTLTFALLGAYLVLVQPQERPLKLLSRPGHKILNRPEPDQPTPQPGLDPRLFASFFFVYAIILHYLIIVFSQGNIDTVGLYAAICAFAIGLTMAYFLKKATMETYKDSRLRIEAIKHYNNLRALDVGHDEAVKGAAATIGMPSERVKIWVEENKGKLRVS